jgi:hypothetical protein
MDKDIGIGLIIGLTIATTLFVYNRDFFTKPQKVFLYICIIFPPLQWLSIIVISIYNAYQISISPEFVEKEKNENEKNNVRKQLENLKDLRSKEILTREEFNEKVRTIKSANIEREIKSSEDYKKLRELYESGILTKEELDKKLEILRLKLTNLRQKQKEEERLGFTVTEEISEGYFVI